MSNEVLHIANFFGKLLRMTVVSGAPFIINFVTAVFDIIFKALQRNFF